MRSANRATTRAPSRPRMAVRPRPPARRADRPVPSPPTTRISSPSRWYAIHCRRVRPERRSCAPAPVVSARSTRVTASCTSRFQAVPRREAYTTTTAVGQPRRIGLETGVAVSRVASPPSRVPDDIHIAVGDEGRLARIRGHRECPESLRHDLPFGGHVGRRPAQRDRHFAGGPLRDVISPDAIVTLEHDQRCRRTRSAATTRARW